MAFTVKTIQSKMAGNVFTPLSPNQSMNPMFTNHTSEIMRNVMDAYNNAYNERGKQDEYYQKRRDDIETQGIEQTNAQRQAEALRYQNEIANHQAAISSMAPMLQQQAEWLQKPTSISHPRYNEIWDQYNRMNALYNQHLNAIPKAQNSANESEDMYQNDPRISAYSVHTLPPKPVAGPLAPAHTPGTPPGVREPGWPHIITSPISGSTGLGTYTRPLYGLVPPRIAPSIKVPPTGVYSTMGEEDR